MSESVSEGAGRGNRGADVLCAIGAGLLGALVFSSALSADLVSDDKAIIPLDARIRSLANLPDFFRAGLWESGLPSYRPLLLVSLALAYAVRGPDPAVFHAVGLGLYALATAALFSLARAVGLERRAALAAALVFALHPVHAEAASLVYAQAELLGGIFLFASLALHARGRSALSAGCLFLALLSKETAFCWPLLAAALDLCLGRLPGGGGAGAPSREGRGASLAPRIARLYGPAALAILAYIAVKRLMRGDAGMAPIATYASDSALLLPGLSLEARGLAIVRAAAHALVRLLAPVGLAPSYDGEAKRLTLPLEAADAARLLLALAPLLLAAVAWRWRRERLLTLALLLVPLGLLPSVNPLFVYLTDRGLFLPSAGVALAAGILLDRLVARRGGFGIAVAVPVLLGLGLSARAAVLPYRSQVSHWASAVKRDPGCLRAWRELAIGYRDAGRPDEADQAAARALEIEPREPEVLHLRGTLALRRGAFAEAGELLERALAAHVPAEGLARYHLGVARMGEERPAEAEAAFAESGRLMPGHAPGMFYRARMLAKLGRGEEAARVLEEARRADGAMVGELERMEGAER